MKIRTLIILICLFTALTLSAQKIPDKIIYEGIDIPLFGAEKITGGRIFIGDPLKSAPVYINFFASWCTPCKQEIMFLSKLAEKYDKSKINIVLINTDLAPKDNVKNRAYLDPVKEMIKNVSDNITVLIDPDNRIARLFGVNEIPKSFFIKKNQKCYKILSGFKGYEEDEIETLLINLLKE